MRTRAGISTSDIHLIISKTVSAVTAVTTEVPCPRHNPLAQTVYPLQGPKADPNFENQKKISAKISLSLHYHQKNMLNPLVKSVFKSVDN